MTQQDHVKKWHAEKKKEIKAFKTEIDKIYIGLYRVNKELSGILEDIKKVLERDKINQKLKDMNII
jgi:hypothetical protein